MVRKASRKRGQRPNVAMPPSSSSPRSSAAAVGSGGHGGGQRRGSRANELHRTSRRASMLYQIYDSASANTVTSAHATAATVAATVLASPSGQIPPPPPSNAIGGGGTSGRGGQRTSTTTSKAGATASAARPRNVDNGPHATDNTREAPHNSDLRKDAPSATPDRSSGAASASTLSPPSGSLATTDRLVAVLSVDTNSRGMHPPVASSDDTVFPYPYAKDGSYANENVRLVASDPLPTSTTTNSSTAAAAMSSPPSIALRSRTSSRRSDNTPGQKHKSTSRSLLRDGSQPSSESGGSSSSPNGVNGRPRALSLPRTRESVGEMLPRLRPVRTGNVGAGHPKDISDGRVATPEPGHARWSPRESLRPSLPSTANASPPSSNPTASGTSGVQGGWSAQGTAEAGELRAVVSAPPAPFSDLLAKASPQLTLRRNRERNGVVSSSGDVRQRRLTELGALSGGGGSSAEAAAATTTRRPNNGAFMRSMKVNAAPPPPPPSAFGAVENATANQRKTTDANVVVDNWGDAETSQTDRMGHMFDSTQLLSSLRPNLSNGSNKRTGDAAAAAAGDGSLVPQQARQPIMPSGARLHPSPATAPDATAAAAAASPSYRFNVVLSSGKTTTIPISLMTGNGCVQGMRPTMEDAHFIQLNATHVRGQPISLMGVLDGHCGRLVADLGVKWLPHYVLHHPALGENNALALVESILQTDREIFHIMQAKKNELEKQRKSGRSTGRRRREVYEETLDEATGANGGSTLIVAAVCGRMLYVACLGDARAVLYDGQTTIAMSEDHKPGNADESRRIAKCGGFVQFGRVCGILAVSRALGDYEFKFQPSSTSEEGGLMTDFPFGAQREGASSAAAAVTTAAAAPQPQPPPSSASTSRPPSQANRRFISNRDLMVSNVADVRQLNITDASAFLLLACDGLWDVLSNEEATEFVRDFLSYTPDVCDPRILSGEKPRPSPDVTRRVLNNCCQKLTEFAVDRGSMDNVSVMVLFFHDVVDTVARLNGRQPTMRESRSGNNGNIVSGASAWSPRVCPGGGPVQPSSPSSSAFERTNNQLRARNGRAVARR